ncbi:MAG: UDP-N-acetylmuramate dehydrogenase [Prevotellaceae bacterium]|jgi:UDP-N-acetylmuramate dehydrogenase|nr:UDP-N-acetylmuramate dehydrogenase [Prevotellaceae bacterium]
MQIKENFSLLKYNTFGIDVRAGFFVEYSSAEELCAFLKDKNFIQNKKILSVGKGANLLFLSDFNGIILHSKILGKEIIRETETEIFLRAGAGETWDDIVDFAVKNGWGGAENLSHIPSSVGASVVQNIGAYGAEVQDLIFSVETVEIDTGNVRIFTKEECKFAYRSSAFKTDYAGKFVITQVTYILQKKPVFILCYGNLENELKDKKITLQTIRETIINIRSEKLPAPETLGNAGSFFTNPVISKTQYQRLKATFPQMPCYPLSDDEVKIPAAWLIEHAGWKGFSDGKVGVHNQQALVLVNRGSASGADVAALSDKIRESVRQKFDITLVPEVIFVS